MKLGSMVRAPLACATRALAIALLAAGGVPAARADIAGDAAGAAAPAGAAVVLAPYRAAYDLALADGGGRYAGADGEIVFQHRGDVCSGLALEFRQRLELTPHEGAPETVEVLSRTREAADGGRFEFWQETHRGSGERELLEGVATRSRAGDGAAGVTVAMAEPDSRRINFSGDIVFPAGHLQRVLAAAQAGQSTLSIRLYEPGADGATVYDTFVVIGRRAAAAAARRTGAAERQAGLERLDRWPVTISYYEPGPGERTPAYALAFDLYENGVSGDMRITLGATLGALKLDARLVALEVTGDGRCHRGADRGGTRQPPAP